MRTLLLMLLMTSSASADEMSPAGCNAMSGSAARAADSFEHSIMFQGDAFRAAIPSMPPSVQTSAADVEAARKAAEIAVSGYAKALREFSARVKDCGK